MKSYKKDFLYYIVDGMEISQQIWQAARKILLITELRRFVFIAPEIPVFSSESFFVPNKIEER